MFYDPDGHAFLSVLIGSIIVGAIIGGTYKGITAYKEGIRGWDLVFNIAGGAIMGGAIGAAMALGGAAGLSSLGLSSFTFGISTGAAFGLAVGVTAVAGLAQYSLQIAGSNIDGSHEKWNWAKFALSGIEGGLQGAATFWLAYLGGRAGLFTKGLTGISPSGFMTQIYNRFGQISTLQATAYAGQLVFSNLATKFILLSTPGFITRYIIDKIIYGN